ncbi:MAG: sialidase family protein [Clostridia bacterium]|nr:sialidase family protein [Clostridia bacterium]
MKSKYINCRFLYEDSANNMNRVVPLEDGSLFTLGVIKRDLRNMGAYIKHQFIFYRKSFDGGKTWTPPKTLFEIPEQQIYVDLAQFMISRDGFLHVFAQAVLHAENPQQP